MKKYLWNLMSLSLIVGLMGFASCSSDDNDPQDKDAVKIEKKHDTALLLCSFGSTYEQPQATYDKIIADYQKAFPDVDIYMSFTSKTIVNRVYASIGKAYAKPKIWLLEFPRYGYKNVYVQSLHIIPGEEYLGLMNQAVKKDFMGDNPDIRVARSACLLNENKDIDQVAKILYEYYKPRLDKGEVVTFMGHGNPDKAYGTANQQYSKLEEALQKLSGKGNMIVATVDWGDKMFKHVRESLLNFAEKEGKDPKDIAVTLTPLMSIAGDHAQNDMLGGLGDGQKEGDVDPYESDDDPEFSWILKIKKLGFQINPNGTTITDDGFNVLGLADHAAIRKIWVEHMKTAIEEATTWNEMFEEDED